MKCCFVHTLKPICIKDLNECFTGNHNCDENASCMSIYGGFECKCNDGFTGSGETGDCNDIDECLNQPNACQEIAKCENSVGSFECNCNKGYTKSGNQCVDENECETGTHTCKTNSPGNAPCENTPGSFKCPCKDGYFKGRRKNQECKGELALLFRFTLVRCFGHLN